MKFLKKLNLNVNLRTGGFAMSLCFIGFLLSSCGSSTNSSKNLTAGQSLTNTVSEIELSGKKICADSKIYTMEKVGDFLVVGGNFDKLGDCNGNWVDRVGLGLIHIPTKKIVKFSSGITGNVYALKLVENRLFVGGNFQMTNSPYRKNLLAYNATTFEFDEVWGRGDGISQTVTSLATDGLTLFVGGLSFTFVENMSSGFKGLAAYEIATRKVLNWKPQVIDIENMAYKNGYIYFVGGFTEVNGVYHPHFSAVDAVTGALHPNHVAPSGYYSNPPQFSSLAIAGERVYLKESPLAGPWGRAVDLNLQNVMGCSLMGDAAFEYKGIIYGPSSKGDLTGCNYTTDVSVPIIDFPGVDLYYGEILEMLTDDNYLYVSIYKGEVIFESLSNIFK